MLKQEKFEIEVYGVVVQKYHQAYFGIHSLLLSRQAKRFEPVKVRRKNFSLIVLSREYAWLQFQKSFWPPFVLIGILNKAVLLS